MLAAVRAIAGAVELPVTADMEAGYGDTPDDAAATARGVLEAGAVGLNLEDTCDEGAEPLLSIDRFVLKIGAVRAVAAESGVPLVLNARTDVFIGSVGDPATRLARSIERGQGVPRRRRRLHLRPRRHRSAARSRRSSRGSAGPSAFSPSRARRRSPISPISA